MNSGTISDYDPSGQYGLIEADDGRVVVFNLSAVESALREALGVGTRVKFVAHEAAPAPRAVILTPLQQ